MGLASRSKLPKRQTRFAQIFHTYGKEAARKYMNLFKEKHRDKVVPETQEPVK